MKNSIKTKEVSDKLLILAEQVISAVFLLRCTLIKHLDNMVWCSYTVLHTLKPSTAVEIAQQIKK